MKTQETQLCASHKLAKCWFENSKTFQNNEEGRELSYTASKLTSLTCNIPPDYKCSKNYSYGILNNLADFYRTSTANIHCGNSEQFHSSLCAGIFHQVKS